MGREAIPQDGLQEEQRSLMATFARPVRVSSAAPQPTWLAWFQEYLLRIRQQKDELARQEGRLARDVNLKHPVTSGFDRLASRLLGLEVTAKRGRLFGFLSMFRRS